MQSKGYEILERNYFSKAGEIDIVCKENGYLVFVEVKYRANTRLGYPEEAILPYKMQHIIRTAQRYLYERKYTIDTPVRFDVVVILGKDIQVIQNAFEA
ncbi:putative endonuclease [[Clostridium] polysaccharolyticum]|uniref:Putative endonuclease n=1 Tax=[Clostridium] polysaccharolyticum TaxID=29364 RepID=A0A1I0FK89_9FIRM|nr:putative endonuclease [[Clostridium] polysaccharolyticum]